MGFEIAELWRERIDAVIRQDDRLRVLQLGGDTCREDVVGLPAIRLGRAQGVFGGGGTARQERNMRAFAGFAKRVPRLEPVRAATKLRGNPRGEFVARRQEQLRAEALEQRAPALVARQG